MGEPVYEVVSPVTEQRVDRLAPAAGLKGLDGRRIAFLWDSLFDGDLCVAAMAAELEARGSGAGFVGHEAFGDIHGRDAAAVLDALPDRLRQYRVDAAIVGVGA
jgi:hypothetical protein